ncbi:MAG TPA: hypothetical protein VHT91_13140 [Kofleriaceae bacterium]|nr:hypothetical protein [Kofleriaceae bacterium]
MASTTPPIDRTPVDKARQALDQARQARLQAQADLATGQAALAQLSRTLPAGDPKLEAARDAVARQGSAVTTARGAEKSAITGVSAALAAFLAKDISADVARLDARHPIVLLPLRLETRFSAGSARADRPRIAAAAAGNTPELLVRIYPDDIAGDAHEPELSADEQAAGAAYWAAAQPGGEQLTAWQTLLLQFPAPRAAWIVRVTDPGAETPPSFYKPTGWSRAVEARLLPDRFMVIATRGGVTREAVGAPIVEPLALSVGPDTLDGDQSPIGPDGKFKIDDAVQWTLDFDRAVASGMAIRLPIDAQDLALGFDRVVVLGVKSSLDETATSQRLGALFDAHHYTGGLAFVNQGTPTSNALGTPAAYPPADQNNAHSFAVERGQPLDTVSGSAAQMMTLALGLPGGLFGHVEGADLVELGPARSMNRVLYSSTLGYCLDQMLSPLVTPDAVNEVGQFFSQWVVPRGLCSAFRVGRVPYGILPVTSIARWQEAPNDSPVHHRIAQLIQKLRPWFVSLSGQAPHIGATGDPDQDLLDVLAMDASAREVRVRRVLGNGTWLNLLMLFDWPDLVWDQLHQSIGAAVLGTLGLPAGSHPRVLDMNFSADAHPYNGQLVDTAALSEVDPLGARDYLSWIKGATIDQLHLESLPPAIPAAIKQVLLYRFLRHGALAEYHWWGNRLLAAYSAKPIAAWNEPELVQIVPGTESVQTPWQRLASPVTLPVLGVIDLAAFFDGDFETQLRALTGVGDFRDALGALAPLPTAELERLFTEALDAVSHRLDAWITSLATQRLVQLRQGRDLQPGCFVGAYGWVERLRPETVQIVTVGGQTLRTTPGGYVQAPSMAHAATAAVLRNAYLTHLGETQAPYAVDLSSAQVRMGRFLLDSVRNGQPVGAVLGYLVERALHDAHAESLIDPIRQVAPLVANKIETTSEPIETIAARNVVDGLALRNRWKAGTLFGPGGLPPGIAHRDVLEQQLGQLDRNVDAVADLLLAESVHQVVIGSTAASGAGLDALAQGVRPPDPEVARAPTGGATLTHRLAVVLGATPPPLGPGWSATPTPRAACEPRLDAWIGALLGDPRQVACRVQYPDRSTPPLTRTVIVTLDQLALRPLDALALARAVTADPAASELDRRVLRAAFGDTAPADAASDASFTIVYTPDPAWDRATTRSFPELVDLANAILRGVGGMRPLAAVDVLHPANAAAVSDAQILQSEAQLRVQTALTSLGNGATALQAAIAAVPVTTPPTAPTPAQAEAIRAPLRDASQFGVAAAFPAFVAGAQEGGVSPLLLVDQATSVLSELQARQAQAVAKAGDATAQAQAIFGRDFQLLVGLQFPAATASGAELAQAIAYGPAMLGGDVRAAERWLTGATRVRDALGRWRMLRVLAEASGAELAGWSVAQLPHDPTASWVALPPAPGEARASGKLSLVLHAPAGAPDLTQPTYGLFLDEWVETIPNAKEHTGIAFRHEDTAGEAPQTLLVAVPPTLDAGWSLDALLAIVNETLDNARLRALDLQALDLLAQLIPGIYLAANAGDDTIATMLTTKLDFTIQRRAT